MMSILIFIVVVIACFCLGGILAGIGEILLAGIGVVLMGVLSPIVEVFKGEAKWWEWIIFILELFGLFLLIMAYWENLCSAWEWIIDLFKKFCDWFIETWPW